MKLMRRYIIIAAVSVLLSGIVPHLYSAVFPKNNPEAAVKEYRLAETVYETVFPFEVNTGSPDRYRSLHIRLSEKLHAAFIFSAVAAVIYAAVKIFGGKKERTLPYDTAFVLAGGVYAVCALLLLDGFRRNKI